ncbi:MAG: 16S rRNA processing protein RimM [Oligoflexia bacterium]|nr:16S rRNA processing protein RimM [Oligoflexia bacterium]
MTSKIIPIGRSSKTHGLKGHFILNLYNHNNKESILRKQIEVHLFPLSDKSELSSSGVKYTLSSIILANPNKSIGHLEGIDKIEDITKLFPFEMRVDRKYFPNISEKSVYYCADIVGASVLDNKTKQYVGTVTEFYSNGAQEVAVIRNEISNSVLELPFIELFFTKIDISNSILEIEVPVYLENEQQNE